MDNPRIGDASHSADDNSSPRQEIVRSAQTALGATAHDVRCRFAWLGAALFLALGILRAGHHEPWRDEGGVWLLAHNCESLGDLVQNLHYDGHPYLWPVLAWLLAHVTTPIFSLQVLHLLLATGAVFLVLRYAPWPRWEAALCVFGYFIFFEYSIVCRAYVFALLGAILTAVAWQKRGARPGLGGAGLFLLTQSSVYGTMLGLAFIPLLSAIAWQRCRERTLTIGWCAGWALPLVLGTALTVAMIVPPADAGYAWGWFLNFDGRRLAQVTATCWQAFVPIPDVNTPFPWNSNIADRASLLVQGTMGVLVFVTALWVLRRDFLPLLFFSTAAFGVWAFSYFKFLGSLRHHGHLYLALFVALWLAAARRQPGLWRREDLLRRGLFIVQAIGGIWLGIADWTKPFSANRLAAEWIAAGNFEDHVLAGYEDHPVSGVGMHLRRPIYFLGSERWGTFVVWDKRSRRSASESEVFRRAAELSRRSELPVLLILNQMLPGERGFRLTAAYDNSLISNECFFLYTRAATEQNPDVDGEPSGTATGTVRN